MNDTTYRNVAQTLTIIHRRSDILQGYFTKLKKKDARVFFVINYGKYLNKNSLFVLGIILGTKYYKFVNLGLNFLTAQL